jgi:protein TonB
MGGLSKYFALSLGLHLGFVGLTLGLIAHNVKLTPPVYIDFTLENGPVFEQSKKERPKQQVANIKQPAAPAPRPVQKAQTKTDPQPATVAGQPAIPAHSVPPSSATATEIAPQKISAEAAVPTAAAVPRPVQHAEENMTQEKARQKYLKEHFAYIRDLIAKRLSYPAIFRDMGWSGRMVLAFVVAEDGSVLTVQVRNSSGYPALDRCAVDTVRSIAPFPRPPVAAEIVMPVHFRLQ